MFSQNIIKVEETPTVKEIIELLKNPTDADRRLIEKAYLFAQHAHEGQERLSGKPYFSHVANVGKILASINIDTATIISGLLHDTIEDSNISPQTIKDEFGAEVLSLVEGVTKLKKFRYSGVERYVESLRKFLVAMSHDVRVLIIKLADRLHNIKTIKYRPKLRQQASALETLEIYARLAERFGMAKWKSILEDEAFPYAYPKEYTKLLTIIKNRRIIDEKYAKKIYRSIQKELVINGVQTARVDYRVKNLFSLWKKLIKKEMDIHKVYDILAIRVIVESIEGCYQALGIIHKTWKPVPGRIKDYIAVPKMNGYRSIHTTIFRGDGGVIEIQIRTEEMHADAQYGIAAHLAYKEKNGEVNKDIVEKNASWIKALTQWQKEITKSDEFLEHIHMDFFSNRVFVFTPKGDVIDLPDGSSPIDFAYAIHSSIGDHVSSTKINGKMATIDTKLKNGDLVEISTKETSSPKRKWLDYTKTTLARRQIRNYIEKS